MYSDIEVICSDPLEHRRRVEGRVSEVADLKLPDWQDMMDREYHEWDRYRHRGTECGNVYCRDAGKTRAYRRSQGMILANMV